MSQHIGPVFTFTLNHTFSGITTSTVVIFLRESNLIGSENAGRQMEF